MTSAFRAPFAVVMLGARYYYFGPIDVSVLLTGQSCGSQAGVTEVAVFTSMSHSIRALL